MYYSLILRNIRLSKIFKTFIAILFDSAKHDLDRLLESFSYKLMAFHMTLSDNKCPQVSRTPHSILAYLNDALVWMVSTRFLIFQFSCPFINPLVTVPRLPITISHRHLRVPQLFFNSLGRSRYLSFFSLSFNFTLCSAGTAESTIRQVLFFIFFIFFF